MTQGEIQENGQALRAVIKGTHPAPITSDIATTEDDIVYVDSRYDPATQQEVVLWDDVVLAFNDVLHVRHKARIVPFLKGSDFRILDPRRIAAVPGAVLDAIIEIKTTGDKINTHKQEQEEVSSQDTVQEDTIAEAIVKHDRQVIGLQEVTSTLNATILTIESPNSATSAATSRSPQTILGQTGDEEKKSIDISKKQPQLINKDTGRGPQLYADDLDQTHTNADLGDLVAQIKLGDMYLEGKVAPQNYQLALKWYVKAAEKGKSPIAQRKVGDIFYKGLGVQQDYEICMGWYLEAAEQGDAPAQCKLADLYHYGEGITKDQKLAAEWYSKSAEQGFAPAQWSMGNLYKSGDGVTQDFEKAMEWFVNASDQGYAKADADIGSMYYSGQGVTLNYTTAAEWYLRAAVQHNKIAQVKLGYMYENGEGVTRDYAKALEWYSKAAEQGDGNASKSIGSLYQNGMGVEKDSQMALKWYQKAIDQGSVTAKSEIDSVTKSLSAQK
ncbi:hypothetical protein FBU30_001898 [Linnemannia zychae]|nr:hypothetical protein FBU30_001898 [Linnemannia zychae]